ncbi:MAG: hydroxymethylglutaryl-CoA lyase [Bacteroidota bacterium]|nr:hydroxymethylglutaryl-CoA lyase [Bacteroidota bacterium]
MLKIIETPRDGIQGISDFIPTKKKVAYINHLLKVGFDTLEVGSFVSPKAIPQLRDTGDVLKKIDLSDSHSKVMVLVANKAGAEEAVKFEAVDHISFPFSVSETFLNKNINKGLNAGFEEVKEILEISLSKGKELVVYLSMGFGNPYEDEWSLELVEYWAGKLYGLGLRTIPLSDITGESTPEKIGTVYHSLFKAYPKAEFGFHLHATENEWHAKVDAAYKAGCRRFDTVIGGLGGCPMTGKEMLMNLDTLSLIQYFDDVQVSSKLDREAMKEANIMATEIKNQYK